MHLTLFTHSLPAEVKRRVKALKNLQVKHAKLNAEFEKEIAALEAKYFPQHKVCYARSP